MDFFGVSVEEKGKEIERLRLLTRMSYIAGCYLLQKRCIMSVRLSANAHSNELAIFERDRRKKLARLIFLLKRMSSVAGYQVSKMKLLYMTVKKKRRAYEIGVTYEI